MEEFDCPQRARVNNVAEGAFRLKSEYPRRKQRQRRGEQSLVNYVTQAHTLEA